MDFPFVDDDNEFFFPVNISISFLDLNIFFNSTFFVVTFFYSVSVFFYEKVFSILCNLILEFILIDFFKILGALIIFSILKFELF